MAASKATESWTNIVEGGNDLSAVGYATEAEGVSRTTVWRYHELVKWARGHLGPLSEIEEKAQRERVERARTLWSKGEPGDQPRDAILSIEHYENSLIVTLDPNETGLKETEKFRLHPNGLIESNSTVANSSHKAEVMVALALEMGADGIKVPKGASDEFKRRLYTTCKEFGVPFECPGFRPDPVMDRHMDRIKKAQATETVEQPQEEAAVVDTPVAAAPLALAEGGAASKAVLGLDDPEPPRYEYSAFTTPPIPLPAAQGHDPALPLPTAEKPALEGRTQLALPPGRSMPKALPPGRRPKPSTP